MVSTTQLCASCKHEFGAHWERFDQSKGGCDIGYDQRDGPCTCQGFTVRYTVTPTNFISHANIPGARGNQFDDRPPFPADH